MASERLLLAANAGWRDRDFDDAESLNDFIFGVGAIWRFGTSGSLALDFAFDNEISDDTYSITSSFGDLTLGVASDDTYFAVYNIAFQ